MTLLIIGGLLAVGIVAILLAVLLGVGEQRAESARNAQLAAVPPTPSAPSERKELESPRPAEALAGSSPNVTQPTTGKPTTRLSTSNLSEPVVDDTAFLARNEKQFLPVLNGQFHELVSEIRTLHRQAQQLEQRLSLLTVMVDHIENEQTERSYSSSGIAEMAPPPMDDSLG